VAGLERLGSDGLEAVVRAPFHAYRHVAEVYGDATEAQFRRLTDEIAAARARFAPGTLGASAIDLLVVRLDELLVASRESGRSHKAGLQRAERVLRKAPANESEAYRDWILELAVRVAEVTRFAGEAPVMEAETRAIAEVATWLRRPRPTIDGAA